MKMFLNTREKIGKTILNKKVSKNARTKSFHNFETATKIGILFDSCQQVTYLAAKRLMEYLKQKNKNVEALGQVLTDEMLKYFPPSNEISLFSLEHLTFLGYPKSQDVEDFIKKDFDILINLCTEENLQINYILGLSKAKFKISKNYETKYADFILEFKNNRKPETDELIEKIKFYMQSISKA